jgi:hypothetical protein
MRHDMTACETLAEVINARWPRAEDWGVRMTASTGAIGVAVGSTTLEELGREWRTAAAAAEEARIRLVGGIIGAVTTSPTWITDEQLCTETGISRTSVRRAAGRS